jgi:predicted XRE-type DNA-binding protein
MTHMTPVDQTLFNSETTQGNCMQAAVASLLDLPLSEVPHFAESNNAVVCWDLFETFLEGCGKTVDLAPELRIPDTPYLASGTTVRGTRHMVVMHEGKLLHDPHPSRAGLLEVDYIHIVQPLPEPKSES